MAQSIIEKSVRLVNKRVARVYALSIVPVILAWFALVLWQAYLPFWELLQDSRRLDDFLFRIQVADSGRKLILIFLALLYVLSLILLLRGQTSRRLRVISGVPLIYLFLATAVLAVGVVVSLPRRGELAAELASFAAIIVVAYSFGRSLSQRLLSGLTTDIEAFVLSSALGLGMLAFGSGFLAHFGILSRWSIYALLLFAIAVSVPQLANDLLANDLPHLVRGLKSLTIGSILGQSAIWKLAFPLIVAQALFLFLAALLPEFGSDALSAHLLYSRWFLDAGGWVNLYREDFHFGIPMGYNLLYAIPLALSDEIAAKLIQYWAGILSLAGTFVLGKRLFSSSTGLLAAAILINIPVFAWEMQTAYVDLVFTLFSSLAIYALVRWRDGYERRWLYASALMAGFALNGKLQAVYVIVLIPMAAVVSLFFRKKSLSLSVIIGDLLIPPLFAMLVGSSWYAHNLITTGNPVFPFFNSIFRSPYFPPINEVFDREQFGLGNDLVSRYLLLPWNLVVFPERFSGYIGAAFLLFTPTLLVLGRLRRNVALLAALAAVYGVAMALTVPVSRYLLVILPAGAVLVSCGIVEGIGRLEGIRGRVAMAGTVAAFSVVYILNLPVFLDVRHHSWVASSLNPGDILMDAIGSTEAREGYLAGRVNTYRAQKWASENLPKSARVVTYGEFKTFYLGSLALSVNQVTSKGDLISNETQKLLAALENVGATHLMVNEASVPGQKGLVLKLDSDLANSHLDTLYVRDGTYLFQIGYSPSSKASQVAKDVIFDADAFRMSNDVAKGNRVRPFSLNQGDDIRRGILEIAPAQFEYSLTVPSAKKVELVFGVGAANNDGGDGVLGRLQILHDGGVEEVYRRFINTNARRSTDRRWFDERLDLTPYAGRNIVLRFIADIGLGPNSNDIADWLLWSRPLVVETE
ncbi:MAG: glycosyltransferase family 39 protein [Chloroflexi bacterium]|nr:glycosyltransferase family 39 protein [Chloroflexota bacterium]